MARDGRGYRPRFARLAASPLPRACIALTNSEEKERLLAVYDWEKTRRQLLNDFSQFARRICLKYIFHGKDKEPHPFQVKLDYE